MTHDPDIAARAARLNEAQRAKLMAMPVANAGACDDAEFSDYMVLFNADLAGPYRLRLPAGGYEMGMDCLPLGLAVKAYLENARG